MASSFKIFLQDEKGLTTVEYAVAGGLLAAAIILAFITLGTTVSEVTNDLETVITP
jgi:pilus assembly protein Flp/PilA